MSEHHWILSTKGWIAVTAHHSSSLTSHVPAVTNPSGPDQSEVDQLVDSLAMTEIKLQLDQRAQFVQIQTVARCTLCLLNTSISSESHLSDSQSVGNEKFAVWFTWCQTCRRGGHTLHIAEWVQGASTMLSQQL